MQSDFVETCLSQTRAEHLRLNFFTMVSQTSSSRRMLNQWCRFAVFCLNTEVGTRANRKLVNKRGLEMIYVVVILFYVEIIEHESI